MARRLFTYILGQSQGLKTVREREAPFYAEN